MNKQFAIAGAGIAGLTAAIALQKRGITACLYEAAPASRAEGAGIVLAANAVKGLEKLGVARTILDEAKFLKGLSIFDAKGKRITRNDTTYISRKYGIDNVTLHRSRLMACLQAEVPLSSVAYNKKIVAVEPHGKGLQLIFLDGSYSITDYLILADGIHSSVRQQLVAESAPRYAGYTCWRAVVQLPGHNFDEASEYWGPKGRIGLVPLPGDQVYWYACINAPANDNRMKEMTVAGLSEWFKDFPEAVRDILQASEGITLLWNDILDLDPMRHYAFNNIVAIGDAAHATTPNMGQGACQAIEDAVILGEELAHHTDPCIAFKNFEQRRLEKTHYIIRQSRTIGKVAQWENGFWCGIRNTIFRMLPDSLNEKRLEKLYHVDFRDDDHV